MFDPGGIVFAGVSLIALVFGLTEFLKVQFSLEGKAVTWLAAIIGLVVITAYKLIPLIPGLYGQILEIIFTGLAFAMAASGFYKFTAPRLPERQ